MTASGRQIWVRRHRRRVAGPPPSGRGGARPGAGRPASPDARTRPVQVRLTSGEYADVAETAAHYQMTVSQLVRVALGLG